MARCCTATWFDANQYMTDHDSHRCILKVMLQNDAKFCTRNLVSHAVNTSGFKPINEPRTQRYRARLITFQICAFLTELEIIRLAYSSIQVLLSQHILIILKNLAWSRTQRCSQLSKSAWNYAPQVLGKVTPTFSPIVNAARKWKSTKKN